ncbi:D-glycero-beta-D-manno-heptose 1,7-bisphosphate 7-phosphatase [Halarcobacter anaerophilus]|uniref:D,D-heptose 1,7-bisphosphate phosphatase n=1 Tax=Halarcobacter anaerophilus TaxID=877500 RepID=A0A4Q0XZD6_9BACT|nr:D-glycero-beta-D-manno-heptose 1,7-bisphosphate 7-phosphatase [Halarcobacter anaerophilus]QDF28377.1 D,D-heptose 1,7-bisphosphate phosphatase [Halarcobacter anaerophilus]RXJ61709.1 D-glycero-beta-D-manno-heptose-1,7-bisphosphate 7-phosphatase [Halarcobacter anaerophilus]
MQKAIFLDRDGVINIEKDYTYKIEEFEFVDSLFDSLKYLQDLGYKLFIITNQSGIARGYYTIQDYKILTNWMLDYLEQKGIFISQTEFCPHGPDDNCNCRKPKTGMIDNILKKHDIDLENSWLIGDKQADIQCAKNANIKNTIQVKSGHKFDEKDSIADFVCDSIKDIKNIIKN